MKKREPFFRLSNNSGSLDKTHCDAEYRESIGYSDVPGSVDVCSGGIYLILTY